MSIFTCEHFFANFSTVQNSFFIYRLHMHPGIKLDFRNWTCYLFLQATYFVRHKHMMRYPLPLVNLGARLLLVVYADAWLITSKSNKAEPSFKQTSHSSVTRSVHTCMVTRACYATPVVCNKQVATFFLIPYDFYVDLLSSLGPRQVQRW